jgi:ATP-dependent RNA helicase DDX19/DBP5
MEKFRKLEINVLITTNMIARGVDVPETELVINFDVPTIREKNKSVPDPATYLHRIGRAGRFGRAGVALTIWDREID